jgi:murein L,D-transpeptidase YcbB/YkuD
MVLRIFTRLLFFSLLVSCSNKGQHPEERTSKDVGSPETDLFDSVRVAVHNKIQKVFTNKETIIIGKDTIGNIDSLTGIYKKHNYEPFWLRRNRMEGVLTILQQASADGLNPEDYQYAKLKKTYADYLANGIDAAQAFDLELSVSQALLLYVTHLYNGKVDPVTIFPEWNYQKPDSEIISDSMLISYFTGNLDSLPIILRPHYEIYESLRKTLKLADSLGVQPIYTQKIPYVGRTLICGDTSFVISEIKKRLQSTSEYNFDSLNNNFDEQLRESIKIFQDHVGIKPTGKLDKKTIEKLNFTAEEVCAAIRVNMERFRWLPNNLPEEFVLVNIADYTLRHFKKGEVVYSESVIVGRELNTTPVFEAMMTYIEFNPYWTVPHSIATKEILPSLKRNPDYLQSHNMNLFKGNDEIAMPHSFSNYTEENFPFTIRENPGTKNSLGQVKFMFPNPYSIYLHDTPGKYLFDRDERSFSHGCIRLKNPLKFALHVLSTQGVTQKQIDQIVQANKNYVIPLKNKLPVMLTYFTCYSKKGDSHPYFFKDIYGKDKAILEALEE